VIIATAGHVDHGKTSLVKQLTGIDTDRLEEERRRGLSINLGFAYREIRPDCILGFIDVPGHTRFINTMIAGVTGIDMGMLVVAADDGLMPQTREHLEVLRLLGVTRIVSVITKIDRVEPVRMRAVHREIDALLPANTRAFAVDNLTGEGVHPLQEYLDREALAHKPRSAGGHFRLSIDRAFSLKGTGLVVTGTALAGSVAVGDSLLLSPRGEKLRVRGMHVQDRVAEKATAGQRCALNLVGNITKEQIERGDSLSGAENIDLSQRLDGQFELLGSAPFPLKHLSPVRLHIGAKRVAARLYVIDSSGDARKLTPGASARVQLILDAPIACCRGDRFLLRDDSEQVTLGGGMILDPQGPQRHKANARRLTYLRAMAEDRPADALENLVLEAGQLGDFTAFKSAWNLRDDEGIGLLETEKLKGKLHLFEAEGIEFVVSHTRWQAVELELVNTLRRWHCEQPLMSGIKPGELKSLLLVSASAELVVAIMGGLLQEARLCLVAGLIMLPDHQVQVSEQVLQDWKRLRASLAKAGVTIPLLSELSRELGVGPQRMADALRYAVKSRQAYKVTDTRYGLPEVMREMAQAVNDIATHGEAFSVIDYKQRIGTGRKLAIELLEYFDAIRFTQRRDNARVALDPGLPETFFSE
jgi:selenocysteine-specific elongation factor